MKSMITLIAPPAMNTLSTLIHRRGMENVQKDRIGVLKNKLL